MGGRHEFRSQVYRRKVGVNQDFDFERLEC